ncbi:MAG: type II secretion system protein GspJ [Gammaproteobacteria bacterium TMED1]|nr:MAG: type II secretion system protein GspJ [Gammaproteobacteria bacterium TMED1]|tara:strand:+ start:157 stop:843 length:687 start_codon:yes stop_codon:yes gene_type:complete
METHERGFTLLEVLVAISIFAIISLVSTQLLRSIIKTESIVNLSNKSINDVGRALNVVYRDVSQLAPRNIRDEYGDISGALIVGQRGYSLELSRSGWNNPALHSRSELQRVAYKTTDGTLYRYFWLVLDRAEDSQPRMQRLLDGVKTFQVKAITQPGESTDIWPAFDREEVLPLGIEIILAVESVGEIRRTFVLPEAARSINKAQMVKEGEELEGNDGLDRYPVGQAE